MSNTMMTYLSNLAQNNNRDWYHAHKSEYQEAMKEFEDLIGALIVQIGKVDKSIIHNEPKDLTFKLVRDTRFSHDKSPYNPVFRAHISAAGKLPIPVGYFLFIAPEGRSFLGGGLFADMFKDATSRVKEYINANTEEFLSLINEPAFAKHFKVEGSALKKVPKEYSADSLAAEYLKFKSWYIEDNVSEDLLADTDPFVSYATERFLLMKPFNDFLNRALEGFKMPER